MEEKKSNKKILIIILALLTAVLAGASIYLGYKSFFEKEEIPTEDVEVAGGENCTYTNESKLDLEQISRSLEGSRVHRDIQAEYHLHFSNGPKVSTAGGETVYTQCDQAEPRLAVRGAPTVAFINEEIWPNNDNPPDSLSPLEDGLLESALNRCGEMYLTDDANSDHTTDIGDAALYPCTLIIDFDIPTMLYQFDILDIDVNERYSVEAYDADGNIVHQQNVPDYPVEDSALVIKGDEKAYPYNGLPLRVTIPEQTTPIWQVQVKGYEPKSYGGWGWATDNFFPICQANNSFCGDGTCDSGETCEDAGVQQSKSCPGEESITECRDDCTFCGDGVVNGTEACDPEDPVTGANCNADCTVTSSSCGDSNCDSGETCENPGSTGAISCPDGGEISLCRTDCTYCGDGTVNGTEACDPEDPVTGANCNANCETLVGAECGDENCDTGERCENPGSSNAITCMTDEHESIASCRADCTYCGDGFEQEEHGEQCDYGEPNDICDANCQDIDIFDAVCVELEAADTEITEDEIINFNLVVSSDGTRPYTADNVKLRVTSTANNTPVGEDVNDPGEAIVSVASNSQSADNAWLYTFQWQATDLVQGSYEAEVSFDGGTTWQTVEDCIENLVYTPGNEVDPEFVVVKTGTVTQTSGSGAVLNYTITVTNLGPGEGILDRVEDDLESGIQSSWVSNITSSKGVTGSVINNVIVWIGTQEQRTYSEGESSTFSYRVTIPSSSIANFADGIGNVAIVYYGDDIVQYNYYVGIETGSLPATGFFDSTPWILGLSALVIGLIALKLGGGQEYILPAFKGIQAQIVEAGYKLGLGELIREKKQGKLEDMFEDQSDS